MKGKTVIILFIAFVFALYGVSAAEKEMLEHHCIAKELYDAAVSVDRDEFYAKVNNLKNIVLYTNAKSLDKYKLMRILEIAENDRLNANAENQMQVSKMIASMFCDCKIYNEGEFFARIRQLYDRIVPENNTNKNGSSEAANITENKFISALLCEGGGKNVFGSDGLLWIYGDNYFCSFDRENSPVLVSADMNTDWSGMFKRLNNKVFFSHGPVKNELFNSNGITETYKISSELENNSYIIAEKDLASGRFYLLDFSFCK